VLVAKLDATANQKTSKRFGVKGFPTLKFFADGKVHTYNGGRDVEAMLAFATGGYADAEGDDVPAGPQWYHEVVAQLDPHLMDDLVNIVALRKTAAALLAIGGGIIGALLTMMVCGCDACSSKKEKAA
jgi:thioredoxin-like negative regulator of GroEL